MLQKLIHGILRNRAAKDRRRPDRMEAGGTVRISADAKAVIQSESLALFHAGRGVMFKANGPAAQIWEALEKGTPVPRLAEQLAARYSIPLESARQDVAQFVGQLRSAGLVSCEAA